MIRFLLVTLVFLCAAGTYTPARAGILEFFFPTLAKKEPDLSKTLRAPFADDPASEEENGEAGTEKQDSPPKSAASVRLPENDVPLDKPHRQTRYIGEHVSDIVAQALTFQKDNYKEDLREILKNFDETGKAQYWAFLQEKGVFPVIQNGKFYVRSFVMDVPILLNAGAVGGRYRWLFEVPVMVSYTDRSVVNYKEGLKPKNQNMTIRLQVGRHNEIEDESGLLIETWSARVQTPKTDKN